MKKSAAMTLACLIVVSIAFGGWFFSDFWKEAFPNRRSPEAPYWAARKELRQRLQGSWVGFEKVAAPTIHLENETAADVELEGAVIDRKGTSIRHRWFVHLALGATGWKIAGLRDMTTSDPDHRAPAYLKSQ